jgi:hypothetical protein
LNKSNEIFNSKTAYTGYMKHGKTGTGLTGTRPPPPSVLASFPFTLRNGSFNRIPDKPVIPFIVKGLLGSYHGFYQRLKLLMAGFAKVPIGHMKIRPLINGGSDIPVTYITF